MYCVGQVPYCHGIHPICRSDILPQSGIHQRLHRQIGTPQSGIHQRLHRRIGTPQSNGVEHPLGLAWKGDNTNVEGLSANGAASNGADGLHLVFCRLHGLKDSGEMAALIRSHQIMEEGMVRVVLAEYCH